jgi:hypothetical protein
MAWRKKGRDAIFLLCPRHHTRLGQALYFVGTNRSRLFLKPRTKKLSVPLNQPNLFTPKNSINLHSTRVTAERFVTRNCFFDHKNKTKPIPHLGLL